MHAFKLPGSDASHSRPCLSPSPAFVALACRSNLAYASISAGYLILPQHNPHQHTPDRAPTRSHTSTWCCPFRCPNRLLTYTLYSLSLQPPNPATPLERAHPCDHTSPLDLSSWCCLFSNFSCLLRKIPPSTFPDAQTRTGCARLPGPMLRLQLLEKFPLVCLILTSSF